MAFWSPLGRFLYFSEICSLVYWFIFLFFIRFLWVLPSRLLIRFRPLQLLLRFPLVPLPWRQPPPCLRHSGRQEFFLSLIFSPSPSGLYQSLLSGPGPIIAWLRRRRSAMLSGLRLIVFGIVFRIRRPPFCLFR